MKKMLKKLVCLVMVVMVVVATSTTIWVSAYNYLINDGFESAVWSGTGTTGTDRLQDTAQKNSGSASMKLIDTKTGAIIYGHITPLNIDPTKYYRLVYYVRTSLNNADSAVKITMSDAEATTPVTYTDRGSYDIITRTVANTWTKVERTITPLADSNSNIQNKLTKTGRFYIQAAATIFDVLKGNTTWYDDFSLIQYDPDTYTIGTPTYNKDTGAVSVNITNNFTATKSVTVIVAQYKVIDGKPYLEGVQTESKNLAVGSTNPISKTFTPSADPSSFVKVFLWDGLTDMKPLANAVQAQ